MWKLFPKEDARKITSKKEFKNAFKLYEFKKSFINHENLRRRYN